MSRTINNSVKYIFFVLPFVFIAAIIRPAVINMMI